MASTGISVISYADAIDRTRELVRVADDAGLEYVGIQDHPYQARFLDTFAPTISSSPRAWNSWQRVQCAGK